MRVLSLRRAAVAAGLAVTALILAAIVYGNEPHVRAILGVAALILAGAVVLILALDRHFARIVRLNAELVAKNAALDVQTQMLARRTDELSSLQATLRASEARLRALLGALPDVILVLDLEARVLEVVPTTASSMVIPTERQLGCAPHELFAAPLADALLACVRRAAESRSAEHLDYSIDLPAGTRWYSGTASPLDRDRLLWVARDITLRIEAQQRLEHAQKMEDIGRLAGGVAHDFNNLLTVIANNVDLAVGQLPSGSGPRNELEEIRHAARRASQLTRQLLAFSRRQVLMPRALDLNVIVGEAQQMLARVIGEDVSLTQELDPNLAPILADRGQIDQILLNLAVNARDAMPHGGLLHIATARVSSVQPLACVDGALPPGDYVRLTVQDSGIGMDESTRSRIFEPFFTTKPAGQGTGLGLATVYGIVKQSNGFIAVDTAPGRGAAFDVYFPVAPAGESRVELAAATAGADDASGSETLLLVEDEAGVRSVAERILQRGGYTVITASSGAEALERAAALSSPIHLLITDVVMPAMSGRALAEHLRVRWPALRVLFVSGYSEEAVSRHGVLAERAAFLEKPFDVSSLLRRVRELLDTPHAG